MFGRTTTRATHVSRSLSIAAAVGLVTSSFVAAAPGALAAKPAAKPAKAMSSGGYGAGRYIVTFADEPAATYEGNVAGYARTRPDRGQKLDPTRSEVIRWRAHLTSVHDAALQAAGASKLVDYTVATNGVAADLTAAQANKLARTAGVVRLERATLRHVTGDASTANYLGLKDQGGLWAQTGGGANAGSGVIIGVIDSGIWPESPSFAGSELKRDKAGLPVPSSGLRGKWWGPCVQGENFDSQDCNDKLIGARFYTAGFGKQDIDKSDYLSPRDGNGHGSHTASTAAGNIVNDVTLEGTNYGTTSGMAPGADIAAYKACWHEAGGSGEPTCSTIDIVSAIDDAVSDGVDVINMSLGADVETSIFDNESQAERRAANVGIFIANSAGNSGPGASTLDHPAPWVTTVAASTYRISEAALELGDGQRFVGASITRSLPDQTPLVTAASVKLATATDADAARCFAGTLDPAKATGKIVLCDRGVNDRTAKGKEVKRAGGAAMVLANTTQPDVVADLHVVPAIHIHSADRTAVLAYIAGTTHPTAAIVALKAGESSTQVPEVIDFSSRGPSTTTHGDILKPDLSAPGVDVLAAVAPPFNSGRSYDFYSGTSMSSPHIAGLGALLKAAHPKWSAAAIRSALMTTARDHKTTTDPFAQGAGFVAPNAAVDPGLVFDETADDWRQFMIGQGFTFTGAPYNTWTGIDASDLNQSSIAIGALTGEKTVERAVTNVSGDSEHYTVSAAVPGITVAGIGDFDVAAGETKTLHVKLTRDDATLEQWTKGSLTFTGSRGHVVRIPVAVRPVAVSAPVEVTGSGTSGVKTFSVTPGFTGTLHTTASGLVGAKPSVTSVTTGPFDLDAPVANASTLKYSMHIDAGTRLARFDVDATSNSDDLDLYVYKDGEFLTWSASESADEQVTLQDPEPGDYVAYVNGFDTSHGGGLAFTQWAVPAADAGNVTVSVANPVTLATPVDVTASWSGLDPALRYLGVIGYESGDERTIVSIG